MATFTVTAGHRKPDVALSDRELEVLTLVLEGKSSKEVARQLFVSRRTIDFHLAKIYDKLNVSNRVQAIRRAAELGLLPPATHMIS